MITVISLLWSYHNSNITLPSFLMMMCPVRQESRRVSAFQARFPATTSVFKNAAFRNPSPASSQERIGAFDSVEALEKASVNLYVLHLNMKCHVIISL